MKSTGVVGGRCQEEGDVLWFCVPPSDVETAEIETVFRNLLLELSSIRLVDRDFVGAFYFDA